MGAASGLTAGPGGLPRGAEPIHGELHAGAQPLDGTSEAADLVGTPYLGDGGGEITAADAVGDLGQAADRTCERARQEVGGDEHEEDRDAEQDEGVRVRLRPPGGRAHTSYPPLDPD